MVLPVSPKRLRSFMANFVVHVFQYADYLLELAVLALVVCRGQSRRLGGVSLYLISLVGIDAILRPVVLYGYGIRSNEYYYVYWLSNVALQLAAFLLVCSFFRSACSEQPKWWHVLKLALPLVFLLTVSLSVATIWRNWTHLRLGSLSELEQDLYFASLILNTLLFISMQYLELADDRLPMLVCGLGLQFAGPAASMALMVLTHQSSQAQTLLQFVEQLCTLGMLLTWMHAVRRPPSRRTAALGEGLAARAAA